MNNCAICEYSVYVSRGTNRPTIFLITLPVTNSLMVRIQPFTLQPLEFGNGLSQNANAAKDPALKYDPYTGATVHVNNNTRDLAGIVRKGSDPSVLEVTTKVWGTNNTNDPNWRPVIRLKGSRYISLIEETPGVYAITLVN